MSIWNQLRAHAAQQEMFRRAIQRGRLGQAYLLVGLPGIGKRLFAHLATQALFCEAIEEQDFDACGGCASCKQVVSGSHPDLLTIGCPEGKRELPIELLVGPPESRGRTGLCHDLSLRPMTAQRRIAIIDDSEKMNEASANSLLKTLEEPPPGAILFLLAPDVDPILPTIRSRCQIVRFSHLSEKDVAELLVESGDLQDETSANEISRIAGGSLQTARELIDGGMLQLKTVTETCLRQTPINSYESVKAIKAAIENLGGDTARERSLANWVLQFCVEEFRYQLQSTTDVNQIDLIGALLDRTFLANQHLKQTMPIPLCLQAMFDDLSRISRNPSVVV